MEVPGIFWVERLSTTAKSRHAPTEREKWDTRSVSRKISTFLLKNILQEFAIHNANEHMGLEEVLANHQDERVRNLIPKLKRQ